MKNGFHRPIVTGYLYPDGRILDPPEQSRDAAMHGGSPAGTVVLYDPHGSKSRIKSLQDSDLECSPDPRFL